MSDLIEWILLVFMSFLPPLLYTIWIRNTEKYNRQEWKSIIVCFLWGASIAIVAAFILEVLLHTQLTISIPDADMIPFLTVVVVAPIAEEFSKPLALRLKTVKKEIKEILLEAGFSNVTIYWGIGISRPE